MANARFRYPADIASPAKSRREITQWLAQHAPAVDAGVVTLLVSELVSNAVVHARSSIGVFVSASTSTLRVEVSDGSLLPPEPRPDLKPHAVDHGRGLLLLDALASAWGWRPTDSGKVVWFEV